ncbi:MAG TPA: 50S ribosomal protein L25 [Atribacter sp.]|jgi:large subunit ribosomal protein L25|uniref:50S ribosomal protein L25 n=1 Tax=Atribacter sp. TaxID=2847780 RepID=UPI0017529784|nr:50S ribosomal protein L25 [Atribacter sp.]MDD3713690.1 50S ribosomal protein L25 [Atribacterota bacterium]HHT09868.1 50S ribosomal protein L25 [Candidatus Atribacteria bacterium]MDI9594895.1 50S ribosomal protein L25 [Atribacterota bacterium]HOT05477.1 50S ribosomal protein L25 [Atribacter sp.]HQK82923.1 50S ribosomal protein L25 [Atribacter sp.]
MNQREILTVNTEKRESIGKENMKRLRRSGWVPGIYYAQESKEGNTIMLKVQESELKRVLKIPGATHQLLNISIDGNIHRGIIKNLQRNPIKEQVLHIDFYGVRADQKITLKVPLMFKGEAPGVKAGGTLEQVMQEVEIECLPDVIPEFIEVDINGLEIGDAVHLKNVKVPEEIELTENLEDVVVVVTPPVVLEEEVPEEEIETPEPEVVKKGEKKEKEAEED